MLEVIEKYPVAFAEFFDYAMNHHGMSPEDFSRGNEGSQALTIVSWFGYPQRIPDDRDETIAYLHRILGDFEQAARKHPDKNYDLLKEIGKMDYKERMEKHPELFNHRNEPSVLPSLKDAIIFMVIPESVRKQQEHEEFWNAVTPDPNEAPF